MSQTELVEKQRKTLKIEEAIRLRMETLIPKMQEMAKGYNLRSERSPFRNVLNVATNPGGGIEVTKNFILYQLGRTGANPNWQNFFKGDTPRFQNKKFAVALVAEINALNEEARTVLTEVGEDPDTDSGKKQLQQVHCRLMQLYLGYLARYQAFLAKEDKGNRGSNTGQGRNQRRGRNVS